MLKSRDLLSIGSVADRTGLATSAIRFYEDAGLITAERNQAGHRRFRRSTIRRLSFIQVCQRLGYSLGEIGTQLDKLPHSRTPNEADWTRLARDFAADIDERIAGLQRLREKLDGCIGCGCLSMELCGIYNDDDKVAIQGPGPRYLLGDVSAADRP